MARTASFGSTSVSITGFEQYPSEALPTLSGFYKGVKAWDAVFARDDMWLAWKVFNSFLVMSIEATKAQGQANEIRNVAKTLSSYEAWFTQHKNDLVASNAAGSDIQNAEQILGDLANMKRDLGN